jgi:hypothetical protein
MKNSLLTLCCLFLLKPSLFSQKPVTVSYQQDMHGNYHFTCINRAYCNYILEVGFTNLDNARSDHALPWLGVVKPGSSALFTLSAENTANPLQFKYGITYYKGCIDPKVDTSFTYLLPFSPGRSAQVYELGNLSRPAPGEPEAKNWYAVRFRMKPGDTIYAARRGTVTEVDVSSTQNDAGVAVTDGDNYIEIVHGDCSFAHYGIIKWNGSFVKPGQAVEAGDPIGLVGGDKYGRGSEIRFSVTYNQGSGATPGSGPAQGSSAASGDIYSMYVPLRFWAKKNGKGMLKHGATYTSEFPRSIITQETGKPKHARTHQPVK